MQDLIQIQTQTIYAVQLAAQFIQKEMGKINQAHIETKSLNSLVTYVDKEAEKILVSELKKIINIATFLTEENTIEAAQGEWQWIVDPLDGTTNFIHQIPVFAISVALKYKDVIVVGVVFEINRNELFYATKNNGAYLNGSKIHVSSTSLLSDCLVATGFPYYDFDVLEKYISFLKFLMSHTRGIRRLGAASVDLCYTACGRFDAFFEHSLAPWDVAAGALIVQEAGGIVLDFNSGNNWLFGREMISVNPNISEEFLAAFRSHF